MDKKSELWIAVGGDELTCTVSLSRNGDLAVVKIALRGQMSDHNRYVTNIVLSSIESIGYDLAKIDARDMVFFDQGSVNQYAVECLLKVVIAAVRDGRAAVLSVSDTCIKEVLEDVLGRKTVFRHTVSIHAEQNAAPSSVERGVRSAGATDPRPAALSTSELGKLVAARAMAAQPFRTASVGRR